MNNFTAATLFPPGLVAPGPSKFSTLPSLALLLLLYPIVQQYLRYKRRDHWESHYQSSHDSSNILATMTVREAWQIQKRLIQLEFPTMFEKALQYALFKTYAFPDMTNLLVATRQLTTPEYAPKRYADTSMLIAEFYANDPSSERTIEAFSRMNYIHSVYQDAGKICNDDMLYTLSVFATEPVTWIDKHEWRTLTIIEKAAIGTFVKSMGESMSIDYSSLPSGKIGFQDGLHFLQEISAWSTQYEADHTEPHQANHQTANETTAILLVALPQWLKPAGKKIIAALMDDQLRKAMMYPRPAELYFILAETILLLRKMFLRYLALPRPDFLAYQLTSDTMDSEGRIECYRYEAQPFYVKPTVWNRWGPISWMSRLLGVPLPGDDGDRYHPKGFSVPQVGPSAFLGKGAASFEAGKAKLRKERTAGCPFAAA